MLFLILFILSLLFCIISTFQIFSILKYLQENGHNVNILNSKTMLFHHLNSYKKIYTRKTGKFCMKYYTQFFYMVFTVLFFWGGLFLFFKK
jgi:hypothetical protein